MIGIIGARDTVDMMASVAEAERAVDRLVLRSYSVVADAPDLARALDPGCQLLLFTGRVPYVLASRSATLASVLDYVPHSGVDLYRTLIQLLELRRGQLPSVSLDTITREDADETFGEIGRPSPEHILPLETEGAVLPTSAIADFHAERYVRGEVQACLTCVREVHADLAARGIEAYRISHTRSALRDALRRALLLDRLGQTRATQIAVVMVEARDLRSGTAHEASRFAPERLELQVRKSMLDYAERLRGSLGVSRDGTFLIHTTRGAIEARSPGVRGEPVLPEPPDAGVPLTLGLGIGRTVADAEEKARRAIALSREQGEPHAIVDGVVLVLGHARSRRRYSLRETAAAAGDRPPHLGIGPFAIARLVEALGRLDPTAVTARDLAEAYGIEPRSARRLLARLMEAGLASHAGRVVAPGAGRPQRLFRIESNRLLGFPSPPAE